MFQSYSSSFLLMSKKIILCGVYYICEWEMKEEIEEWKDMKQGNICFVL